MDGTSPSLHPDTQRPLAGAGVGHLRALVVAMLIFAALSTYAALASKGFLEGDASTHYMIARFSLRHKAELVGIWGRPVVTAIYAVPAVLGGRQAVRATALLLALVGAFATYRVARNQGYRWPAVAAICLLAQPLFFLHSFSELTELPFATLLILAFWAYQKRQFLVAAILISIGPATRPEGFGFLALAAIALIAHRRWYWAILLPLPLVIWSYAGWKLWGCQPYHLGRLELGQWSWLVWLKHAWPYSGNSVYEPGPIHGFLMRMPVVVSPALFPMLCLGIWRSGVEGGTADHRRRCQWMIAALPILIFLGHSFLWWRGKMASSGELRYMLIMGPFWALCCGRGFEWAWGFFGWRRPLLWLGIGAFLPVFANISMKVVVPQENWGWRIMRITPHPVTGERRWLAAAPRIVPLPAYQDDVLGEKIAAWYGREKQLAASFPRVMATPPSIYYSLDISKNDRVRACACGRRSVRDAPDGTILIWDEHYGPGNANADLCVRLSDIRAAGWIHYRTFTLGETSFEVFLSPKTSSGEPTPPEYADRYEEVFFDE